jgi:lipopolysaccharide transport system permease protein
MEELPLLTVWARREFRIRYRQSGLGILWSIIQPLAVLAIYGTVLSTVLHVSSEGFPYISFAYSGLVIWTFVSSSIGQAVPALLGASAVVAKIYFPREVIPLAVVGASMIDLGIGTTIFLIILIVQGVGISLYIIALLPIFAVLIVWVASICVLGSVLTVFVRDLRQTIGLLLQLLFFATPIMYSAQLVHGKLRVIDKINPFAVIVTAIRTAALHKASPDWLVLGLFFLIGAIVYIGAIAYTRSVEPRIVDVI